MLSSERLALDNKIRGWAWIQAEFDRILMEGRREAERLLGPDRGE